MTTACLLTVNAAAKQLRLSEPTVWKWVKRHTVEPKATTVIRGQPAQLYDFDEVKKACESSPSKVATAASTSLEPNLEPLVERMSAEYQGLFKSISADLGELVDNTAALKDAINTLKEQNVLLFKEISALRTTVQAGTVTPTPSNSPRLFIKTPDPSPPPPPPPKAKVCIIGLLANQQQMIMKEFEDCFELRMFHSDDARGPSLTAAAQNSDCVLLMANFVSHSIEDAVKSAGGVKHEIVRGGMTTLRDRLVTLFANGIPTKKVATA